LVQDLALAQLRPFAQGGTFAECRTFDQSRTFDQGRPLARHRGLACYWRLGGFAQAFRQIDRRSIIRDAESNRGNRQAQQNERASAKSSLRSHLPASRHDASPSPLP
jgi:hypothetical protein